METKVCTKCGEEKHLSEFSVYKRSPDGHQYWCKACHKIASQQRYAKNRPELINQAKAWNKTNSKRYHENVNKWRAQNAEHVKQYKLDYYEINEEGINAKSRRWYANNKTKKRGQKLREYWPSLSWEEALIEYQQLFDIQNGLCAICGRHCSEFGRDFDVDHNHITHKVRGLLCHNCNKSLGLAYVDKDLSFLYKMLEYIKLSDTNKELLCAKKTI